MTFRSHVRRTQVMRAWSLIGAILAIGCCASWDKAAMMRRELEQENRKHSEPVMRAAAMKRGAVLLPALAWGFNTRHCDSLVVPELAPENGCVHWESSDRRAFRMRDARGNVTLAVRVRSPAWYYARLARRGGTLYVLVPKISRRIVGEATQCECVRQTGYVLGSPDEFAFTLEDLPLEEVEEVEVPIVEDILKWHCKVTAAGNCLEDNAM